nr:hypothetical protein [Saccharopolyspora sp. HNM0983]
MAAGGVGGVALGLWWGGSSSAAWLAVAAFAAGAVVLILQVLYVIAQSPPPARRRAADRGRGGTRPEAAAPGTARPRSGQTRVQPAAHRRSVDEDTRHSAAEALQDEWRGR